MSVLVPTKHPILGASWGRLALALVGASVLGVLVAFSLPAALLAMMAAIVVFAACGVEALGVAVFWALPYMSFNLPTGSFTLKLCDGVAYLFTVAWLARTALRHERIALPPATAQVLVFLAAMAISAMCSPNVPAIYSDDLSPTNRNAPNFRSGSLIIWLGLSWLVVVALYNVVGSRPDLYRRCVRAHILSSGLACLISLGMYGMGLYGFRFNEHANGRSLIFDTGRYLRLAGVAYEPMFLGFYLLTVIPVTLAVRSFHPEWLSRRTCTFVLGLQILAMLLTLSTGGWAGLVIALMVMALLLRPPVLRPRVVVGIGMVIALSAVAFVAAPKLQSIVGDTTNKITNGGDNIRKLEWKVGYDLIDDYPVLGVGPGMARFYFTRYHATMRSVPFGLDEEINNVYINVMAENGIVGFAAFIGCAIAGIGGLMLPLRRFGPKRLPLLCALFASLMGVAAQYNGLNSLFVVYFPVLVGLACAAARLAPSGVEAPAEAPAPSSGLVKAGAE